MRAKRIVLTAVVAVAAMAAFLILTTALASARPATDVPSRTGSAPAADWTLQGRVFRGPVGDETHPLAGVTVEVYGASNSYPDPGSFIISATTDISGWYGLVVPDRYEYYHIREMNPPDLVSVGATSVSGTVRTKDWIEYVGPLTGTVLTGNKFWDRSPWVKWVDGAPWTPDLVVAAETSDTIKVVDVVTTLPYDALKLVEQWNSAHLKLVEHQIEPAGSSVLVEEGSLVWDVPEGGQRVFTLTKWFHVEPCTWTITTLAEELWLGDDLLDQRPVAINKEPPLLWIDSERDPEVYPGEVATFTLSYGNEGGYENGVQIINEFPPQAPLVWSDPQPSDVTANRLKAWWNVGDLASDDAGVIMVGVAITESVPPSTTIEILDWIDDHTGQRQDSTLITFHVGTPPQVGWGKWIGDEPWNPDLIVTAKTSDTIEVVDVVDSPESFNLTELWDPGKLVLLGYEVTDGQVFTGEGRLVWVVPEAPSGVVTLTKWFHVEPCTWERTILEELLSVAGAPEPLVRLVPIEKLPPPVTFPEGDWPWYAQEEILVRPEPPIAGRPTELCAEVINHDTHPHTVTLEFSVANFGIGVPFTPVGRTDVVVPPGGQALGCVVWVPPTPDHWCIQVRIVGPYYDPHMISQRNVDVDEPLVPGEPHALRFPVGNPTGETVTITLGLIPHLVNWDIELSPDVLPDMEPNEVRPVTLTVVPPADLPPDGHVIVDVEAYAEDKLIGGFRKLFRPPVILHRFPDPPYAEREITVRPYPARMGEPTEVCVELYNPTPFPQDGVVFFSWANFGIGIPFTPINGPRHVHIPPHSVVKECIHWIPPVSGHVCLQVELEMAGYPPQRSQRNIDVNEPLVPGEPHTLHFPVGNPTEKTATINLEFKPHLFGWGIELSPTVLPNMRPGMTETVELTVVPPQGMPLPEDGTPIVDVEAFVAGELIGGFRKIYRPPIQLHPFPDPPYAEREITVHPYPPLAGEPTEVCVELYNPTAVFQEVKVLFSWANFGIGIPFTPINGPRVVHLPPHSTVKECIHWIPPTSGHVCLQVELEMAGYPTQRSQRNIDVDEPLVPGEPHTLRFPVGNPFQHPMTITLGLVPHVDGWEFDLSPDVLPNVAPQTTQMVSLTVLPPPGQTLVLPISPDEPIPPDGVPIVDVEAYAGDELIGGFRKVFRPSIPLHPFPDPPYAEREITVEPYPPRAGEPTEVCVELRNPTPFLHDVTVFFSWANFGIGLPFQPINGARLVHLPPFSVVRECVHWIPPVGGHVCLRVDLEIEGQPPQWSQRNIDVDEPLRPNEPHERVFPVGNPFNDPVTITLGLVPHVPGDWGLELSDEVLTNVLPGPEGVREVVLTVTPPEELVDDGHPIVDVEAFVEGELIGGFRKIYRPDVPIHRPRDPIYAESEIFVHPYPPRAREPTEVGVEIRNPTDDPQLVTVTFSFANFGIGLPFHPINRPMTVTVPAHGMIRPATMWIPPDGGLWCIQVEIELPGHKDVFYSQRNIDVGEPLRPNVPHSRPFRVGNPFTYPVTITLGLIPHFPDWGLELSQDVLTNVLPGPEGVREVVLTVTPPKDLPDDGDPIVDVEAFVEGQLIGGFRKIYRPDVPIHRPRDPVYAESEIGVDPYPVIAGQPVRLSVEVFNPTDQDQFVTATFSIAPFGIGLPFGATHIMPNPIRIFVPGHGAARGHVMWRPPNWGGKFCVRVTLQMAGHEPIWSQRNVDVGEPLRRGRPHSLVFPVGGWPHTGPVTVTLGLINHRDGWDVSLSDTTLENLTQPVSVTLTVTPPLNARLGTGRPIVDVEGYVDGELIGGFRKLDVPPINVHKPHEKVYAETELSIDPDPPRLGQDARISAVIQNNGPTTSTVTVLFGWAKFGMGIPFTTTNVVPPTRTVELGAAMTATAWVSWTPTYAGHQCVQVKVIDPEREYEDLVSQRNVDVVRRPPCGQTKTFTFTVYNDSPLTVTVDIGLITFNVPANWQVTTVPSDTLELGPFSEGSVQVIVEIPCQLTLQAMRTMRETHILQQEAGGVPTIDVEGYIDGELAGGIEIQFEEDGFRMVYLPIVLRNS
jgi:hypothetical protein